MVGKWNKNNNFFKENIINRIQLEFNFLKNINLNSIFYIIFST